MRMILCPLASGSSGNAVYVSMGETKILVDAGISASRIRAGLRQLGLDVCDLDGVVITHEHVDHIKGLPVFCRKYNIPVFANGGTWQGILARDGNIPGECRRIINTGEEFYVGGVCVRPFPVPHDAADPVGFVFSCGRGRLGVATDIGHVDDRWLSELDGCQALVLEANHDVGLLQSGPYPARLKKRILSRKGHLCNEDSARALVALAANGTQAAFLAHLSGENNLPELATAAAGKALEAAGLQVGEDFWLGVARKDCISDLLVLEVAE